MMRRSSSRAAAPAGRFLSTLLVAVVTAGLVTAVPPVASAAAAVGMIPQQQSGSAAGRTHDVPAGATASDSADGEHNAPPAAGGLGPDGRAPAPALPEPVVGRTSVQVGQPSPGTTVGFDENTSREMPEKRAADRQVFDNADGTQTLRKYQGREFYQRPDGVWDRIDSSLVAVGNTWRSRAESSVKRFASAANAGEIASIQLEAGKSVGFSLNGASAATAQVSGDEVTYHDARPAADLQVQATPAGTKETIWLKSVAAPTTWDFPLHLNGLTAVIVDGAVLLKDAAGAVQGTIPPGFMEDSKIDPHSGEGARSYGVTYTLTGDPANPILRVAADQAWLADPARVFPVKVDPSVVGKNSNGTTHVQSPYNADNSGDPNLSVGTFNGGGNKSAAYLKFDSVSADLAGQYVLGAKLWMYETYSYSCTPKPVSVYPVTQGWSVGGNKTYPGPSYGAELASASFAHGYSSSCGSQWTGIDLGDNGRNLVHDWTHGAANNGLTVRASETDTFGWKKFASAASANPPYLEVTYTPYWATYGVGAMSPVVTAATDGTMAVTVTNQGRDPWTPTNNYKLGYRLWDSNGTELPDSTTAWTSMPQTVAPGQSAVVNATVKKLPPGSYTLRWDMDDYGYGRFSWDNVPMSAPVTFTIPNQVPAIDSASPPSNFNATTLTPTLALSAHDQDTYPGQGLTYSFKVCDSAGANCTESGVIDSPVWSVPPGALRWSQNYLWYGQVGDKKGSSPWTLGAYLSTRVPQPAITSHLSSVAGGGVDPGVGNYTTAVTDASVVAVGPALSVVRTYNSLDPRRDAAFGSGWSSRWDSRLEPDTDGSGNVVITSPTGQQSRYGRNPDGTFAAPSGQSSTLLAVTGGGWTLRTADGSISAFDAAGRITTITDGSGRAQNLTYNTAGKLATATDTASGRSLTFTWTGNHVTQVTTSSALALRWTYTYTGDQLTTVCDPTTACTGYTYTAGSHYRTTILDANPRAYWRLAETAGTTAVSEVPGFFGTTDGTATDLTYGQAGPLAGSPTTAAGFNGTSSAVRMPDDLVRNTQYLGIELWFKTTSTTGGALFSTNQDLPGTATPRGGTPVLYVGTDGKLYGHLWNGDVAGMTSTTAVNNGAWHHVVLSASLSTQTLFLDGVAIGTQAGPVGNVDVHNFVGVGAFNDRAWPAKPAGVWNHFAGSIAEVSLYHQPLGATAVAEHYAARQTVDALTTITRPGGAVAASLVYNGAADRVSQYTDADGGTTTVGVPTVEGDGFRYASSVGESSPDAYWRMGETTGTVADGQPQLARGTYVRGTGGKTTGPFGASSSGQSFDGTTSHVRLPDHELDGTTQASVELWFKTSATTGGVLFGTGHDVPGGDTAGSMPVLYVGTDGKLYGHFWNGQVPGITTPGVVNDGAWHHVLLSGDHDTQTLYLDGAAVGTQTGTIQNLDPTNFIGAGAVSTHLWPARPANDWGYFTGSISQFALYPTGLSATDAQEHYAARTSRNAYSDAVYYSAPHAWWSLGDENSSAYAANERWRAEGEYRDVTLAATPALRGGAAASFNGTSSRLELPIQQATGRSKLSLEMWFQTSATTGGVLYATGNDLPGAQDPYGAMPVLYVGTDGKLYGHFWNGQVAGIATDKPVNDGAWHHVVLAAAGDTQSLYLDGNLVGAQAGQIDNVDFYDLIGAGLLTTNDWAARPANDWGYFSGSIGEVALYHRPLDTASIAAHYAAKTAATAVRTTDPAGGVTTTTYDPTRGGRLISSTTPGGGTQVFGYDTGGFLNRITDANGNATTLVNDSRGNALSRTTCRTTGTTQCFTGYRSYYLNTADPLDRRNDQVTEDRDARSASAADNTYLTRYTYTATGDIASIAAPGATTGAQRSTTNTYTAGTEPAAGGGTQSAGLLATITDPANSVTRYTYTAAGDLAQTTDPVGLVVGYTYDGIGRMTSQNAAATGVPGGAITTFAYDGMSRLTQRIDPATSNAVTAIGHQRRATTVYHGDGTIASSTVDDVAGVDPARTSTFTYDTHGRVATATDSGGGVTTTGYDAFGAVTTTTDPSGTEFVSTYTAARHQLATVTVKGFTGDGQPAHDVVLESRAYDPAGRLASVTDAMGRTTAYTYFNDNQPARQTLTGYLDPVTGATRDLLLASYTYTGTGAVATATKGDGRYSTTIAYDPGGRATTSTDRDRTTVLRSTDVTVDAVDNPIRVVQRNADGTVAADVETTFDRMGRDISRATHTTSSATLVATTTRDERGLPLSTVDPRGTVVGGTPAAYTTSYAYDALGQLTTITAPPVATESGGQPATTVSPVSTNGYNTYGDTVDTRDPRGAITHATYDNAGRPTGSTLPAYTPPGATTPITASTTTAYDPAGRVTATTDQRGNTTTYGYDQLGNQRQKTDPPALFGQAGGTWLATHDPLGERLSTSDPTAARTYATYDQLGRQITSTVAERVPAPTRNLTTSVTYDPLGNSIKVTEPGGAFTTATFDDLGNQLTSTNALGKTSTVSYDGAGRPTAATDPLGAKTVAGLDQAGQLLTQSDLDAIGTVLRTRGFGYDRAGNLTTATDPLGITTTNTFDAANQLTSTTRPTSPTTSTTSSYGYDQAGNITRRTDGNGHITLFTVTPWNLPESTIEPATAQTPAQADRTYTVGYDRNGQTATLAKPGGVTITNTYDPQGNLTKQTGTGASVATPARDFRYDAVGNLTSVSAPGGSNTYSYDDRGNVASATGPSGTSNFTINDNNQQSSATTAAGTATYTYDAAGRLSAAADPLTGATASYGYDDADRLTSTGYGTGNATRSYSYDALGRPANDTVRTPAGTATASTSYGFDTADHLTSKTTTGLAGAAANTYTYDQAGQLTSWNTGPATTDYSWDGAGNLTRDGPTTATYNERNQLTTKGITSYTYTPRGTQASRTTGATTTNVAFNAYDELITDGTTTNTYDGLDRLTASGTATLTYAGTGRAITADGTSTYSYTPGGTPLGVKRGVTASMAVADLHTDLTALLNPATGAVAGSRSYSPLGQVAATGGTQTALGYQGQYTDPGSGNVNMGARWYQPSTGGFASRDTAGLDPRDTATANRYGYAAGNPLTEIDPTGHNPICAFAGEVIAGRFLGPIGDIFGQIACPTSTAIEWDIHDNPCQFYGLCVVPDYDLEHRQLQGLVKRGGGVGPQRSGGCGKSCGNSGGRKPTGTSGKKHGTTGGQNGYSADAAAAARAAAERARAARVNNDALTPHARPQSDPTISPGIQAQIDAANNQASIDLGTLGFRDASVQDKPYLPDADEQVSASPESIGGLIAAGYLAYLASKAGADDGVEGPPDGYEVFFGQKRADPNFSTKPGVPEYLKGRSLLDVAEDLRSGRIGVDQIRLEVFEYGGKLVSTNTRGLAALSLAGKRPTNLEFTTYEQLSKNTQKRLNEVTPYGDSLPAARIAITEDRRGIMILYPVQIP